MTPYRLRLLGRPHFCIPIIVDWSAISFLTGTKGLLMTEPTDQQPRRGERPSLFDDVYAGRVPDDAPPGLHAVQLRRRDGTELTTGRPATPLGTVAATYLPG